MSLVGLMLSLFVACSTGPSAEEAIQGTWQVELSEADMARAAILRLGLQQPPPTDAELSQADLTPEDEALVRSMLAAREADPAAPQLAEMQARLAGLASVTLEVTDRELRFTMGGTTQARPYTVLSSSPSQVRLSVQHPGGETEEDLFELKGDGAAALTEPSGKSTALRRVSDGG